MTKAPKDKSAKQCHSCGREVSVHDFCALVRQEVDHLLHELLNLLRKKETLLKSIEEQEVRIMELTKAYDILLRSINAMIRSSNMAVNREEEKR